jgi:hypothetical protein
MAFKKGMKKLGGRKKGIRSVKGSLRDHLAGIPFDWQGFSELYPETYARIFASLQPKSVELSGQDGSPILVEVINYCAGGLN